jgi:SAM-dependent methyltransferase
VDGPKGLWLDVPCGAGRLTPLLPQPVVQVDRDLAMVRACPGGAGLRICASAHRLPFADGLFAGVLCMRLLHHIPDATERRAILGELSRVSRGPVILSFFHALSLQHLRRQVRRGLGRRASGRSAVTWRSFRRDLDAANLHVVRRRPLRRFFSEQWLVLAVPKAVAAAAKGQPRCADC